MRVDNSTRSGDIIRISLIFLSHEGMLSVLIRIADSDEYTQYTGFNIKKKITLNYRKSAAKGFFS